MILMLNIRYFGVFDNKINFFRIPPSDMNRTHIAVVANNNTGNNADMNELAMPGS